MRVFREKGLGQISHLPRRKDKTKTIHISSTQGGTKRNCSLCIIVRYLPNNLSSVVPFSYSFTRDISTDFTTVVNLMTCLSLGCYLQAKYIFVHSGTMAYTIWSLHDILTYHCISPTQVGISFDVSNHN